MTRPFSVVVATLAACATGGTPQAPVDISKELAIPDGQALVLRAAATGSQIYACKPKAADPAAYEWAFIAPEADLADADGRPLGKHYAGPTWESSDGSKIVGAVKEKAPAPAAGDIGSVGRGEWSPRAGEVGAARADQRWRRAAVGLRRRARRRRGARAVYRDVSVLGAPLDGRLG